MNRQLAGPTGDGQLFLEGGAFQLQLQAALMELNQPSVVRGNPLESGTPPRDGSGRSIAQVSEVAFKLPL